LIANSKKVKKMKSEVQNTISFDGTVACPKLFGRGGQLAKNGEFEIPSGKTNCEKTLLFSEKTSLRDRGAYENPRNQPIDVLEKVGDARKTSEKQAFFDIRPFRPRRKK
jgi:hypothetical protein